MTPGSFPSRGGERHVPTPATSPTIPVGNRPVAAEERRTAASPIVSRVSRRPTNADSSPVRLSEVPDVEPNENDAKSTEDPHKASKYGATNGSLGRTQLREAFDRQRAYVADAPTTADIRDMETNGEIRVTLPGVSGKPENLLGDPDRAASTLRAVERVYRDYYTSQGMGEEEVDRLLGDIHSGGTKIMDNLFSGADDAEPEQALMTGIQAVKTASEIYGIMMEQQRSQAK